MGAEGENVVARADVRGFHEKSAARARVMSGRSLPVLTRLEELALPTVAAVQGCLPGPRPDDPPRHASRRPDRPRGR